LVGGGAREESGKILKRSAKPPSVLGDLLIAKKTDDPISVFVLSVKSETHVLFRKVGRKSRRGFEEASRRWGLSVPRGTKRTWWVAFGPCGKARSLPGEK
jgi:hypothetical protein